MINNNQSFKWLSAPAFPRVQRSTFRYKKPFRLLDRVGRVHYLSQIPRFDESCPI